MIIILLGVITDDEVDFINRIFSKMNVKMYNISFNLLRNKYDAEEAVSQTFLKIIENIEKVSALSCHQIEPYCIVILKNETFNVIRKRDKNIYVRNVDCFEHHGGNSDVEEEYLRNADKEKLLSCVNRLSDEDKNLIFLRFIYEMGFKQIAKLLGITEEAAKKRSQRILKKLRSYYE